MTLADMPSAAAGQDGAVASGKGPRAGQPKRRSFTAAYKARIVQEYDQFQTGTTVPVCYMASSFLPAGARWRARL